MILNRTQSHSYQYYYNGVRNKDKIHNFPFYNTLFTLYLTCGLIPTGNETARPFYGGITYILDNYKHNQLQVTNIVIFPLCLTSSRTYTINARTLSGYYPKSGYSRTIRPTSEARLLPGYPTTIRSQAIPELSGHHPKPGFSRAIRQTSEAGLLLDNPTTIRSRAIRGLSGDYPKSCFSRTIRLVSEDGLSPNYLATIRSQASPGLSDYYPKSSYHSLPRLCTSFLRRQKRIYFKDYKYDIWQDSLSPHTNSWD